MEVRNAVLGDVPMLVATGALDHGGSADLQTALDRLFEARFNVIFLDFSGLVYIDSGGLSVLRAGVRALGQRGWLGLIGLNANSRRLLEIDGLLVDPRIRVFADRRAALAATGERAST